MKQETLEEAAEKFYPVFNRSTPFGSKYPWTPKKEREAFIEGAKWQQERMYSEEDIREAIHESRMQDDKYEDCIFEQFKKK